MLWLAQAKEHQLSQQLPEAPVNCPFMGELVQRKIARIENG